MEPQASEPPGGRGLRCWACGEALPGNLFPLRRLQQCPTCRADLHACRQCVHWDRGLINQCRHERADPPADRTLANYCSYFRPSRHAFKGGAGDAAEAARAELAALFGEDAAPRDGDTPGAGDTSGGDEAGDAAAAAGRGADATGTPRSAAERARAELEALFRRGGAGDDGE